MKEYAEKSFYHILDLDPDIEVMKVKVNVQVDHIHIVMVIPPRYAVAQVVQYIKDFNLIPYHLKIDAMGWADIVRAGGDQSLVDAMKAEVAFHRHV